MTGPLARSLGGDAAVALATAMRDGVAYHVCGEPGRFAALFDERRFMAALRRMRPGHMARFGVVVTDKLGDGLTFTEPIAADESDAWLGRGHTICASDISAHDERLAAVAAELAAELGADDVRFNAYRSPRGAITPLHTDTRISTTLQLVGRKRWRYEQRSACATPRANAQIDRWGEVLWMNPTAGGPPPPRPDRARMREIELAPGDLLCVPAGAWHEVHTLEAGLALNLSVRLT